MITLKEFRRAGWRLKGRNPDTEEAYLSYKRGEISEADYWREVHKNIKLISQEEATYNQRTRVPRKGDQVILDDKKTGYVINISYDEGEPDEIIVQFYDKSVEFFEYGDFQGMSSTVGGPTRWYISS